MREWLSCSRSTDWPCGCSLDETPADPHAASETVGTCGDVGRASSVWRRLARPVEHLAEEDFGFTVTMKPWLERCQKTDPMLGYMLIYLFINICHPVCQGNYFTHSTDAAWNRKHMVYDLHIHQWWKKKTDFKTNYMTFLRSPLWCR